MSGYRPFTVASLSFGLSLMALRVVAPAAGGGVGEATLDPAFASHYVAFDLGVPPVPFPMGGVTFAPGVTDTLLLAGGAAEASGAIYAVGLTRDCAGNLTGFDGTADAIAAAPFVDGGVRVTDAGTLLHTAYDGNTIAQILPDQTVADRIVDLSDLGMVPSTGGMTVVPPGFPGAGRLKTTSFDFGWWYDVDATPDGAGLLDITGFSNVVQGLGGGPEGILYVPGTYPGFDADHVLVALWDEGRIDAFAVDAAGDPLVATRRGFVTEMAGPEGATIDPVTGDLIFSTFSTAHRVFAVRPIDHCPLDIAPGGGDGDIGLADLLLILADWGACTAADVTGDGAVDFQDLLTVVGAWGSCPG
ncbi:MAG: hypothetical protein HKN62_14080 [Phycisphaerales bacterium]|nr:hypothetical protein [Phycisphaerales bacterium]